MTRKSLRVNFRHNLPGEEFQFLRLLEIAGYRNVSVINDEKARVDLSFCGPYHGGIGDYKIDFLKRLKRGVISKTGPGRHLLHKHLAGGIQPNEKAKRNIWFTGENERPPFGNWDGYFSFEVDEMNGFNVYWPQAWLATNFLDKQIKRTPWNSIILDSENGIKSRKYIKQKRLKFAVAFLGKVHPSRLHILKALSQLGPVDIYGLASRRNVESKVEIARGYKFVVCPENDLYPGYVTEKPIEAYVSECIPIYSGLDGANILNPRAMVNYADSFDENVFLEKVSILQNDRDAYEYIYCQPILRREPNFQFAVGKLKEILDQ